MGFVLYIYRRREREFEEREREACACGGKWYKIYIIGVGGYQN